MATKKQKLQKQLVEKIIAASNKIEKHRQSSANYIVLPPNYINSMAKVWKVTVITAKYYIQRFLNPFVE